MKNVSFLLKFIFSSCCFLFLLIYFIVPTNVSAWENIGTNQVGFAYAEANVNTSQTLPSLTRTFVGFDEPFTLQRPINDVNGAILSFVRDMYFNVQAAANLTQGHTYVLSLGISRPNQYVVRELYNPYYHNDNVTYIDLYDTSDGVGTVYHVAGYNKSWNYDQWNNSTQTLIDGLSVSFTAPHNANYIRMLVGNRDETNTFMYANTWEGHTATLKVISASLIDMGANSSVTDVTNIENQLNDINNNLNGVSNNIREVKDTLTNEDYDKQRQDTIINALENNWAEPSTLVEMIQAPLNFANTLVTANASCQPISLTAFNHSFSIPCGTTLFWNRQDVSTFKLFWNTLFGGLIIYRVALKLFKVVNDAIDPTKDSIEGVEI